jgi:hypothetical protein
MPEDPEAAARALATAQEAEWSELVATETIHIHGVRAFNVGDPVPKSHLTNGVVDKSQVAKVGTKAADAATGTESA